ncbi:integral membrane protein [Paecilomyces variotii No. 5]|uniref:Integral membrane protein n=1 Tax=Byssochlamys spectabilis (strain No. 5 / NBRC 109023) TaxID=1356009 RepID=V5G8H7_BYSSN|nr:integral membrane protein [Paecilomyces variotii No. 5]
MQDRNAQVLAVNILFFIFPTLMVALRVYVRAFMLKQLGVDDWLMGAAHIIYIGYLCFQLIGVLHGTGRHVEEVPESSYVIALKCWFFCELFYILSSILVKISVGFFLLRITVRRTHVLILRFFMVATTLVGMSYFFFALLQCPHHIPSWWTLKREGCIPPPIVVDVSYAASSGNALADWAFGTLPIFIVWDLNMSIRTKIIAAAILGFAAIGSVGTLIRMAYVKTLGEIYDFLYETTDFALWSTIEVGIGISAGCAATLRPLLKVILHKLGIRSSHAGNSGTVFPSGRRGGYIRNFDLGNLRPDPLHSITTAVVCDQPQDSGRTSNVNDSSNEDLIHIGTYFELAHKTKQ